MLLRVLASSNPNHNICRAYSLKLLPHLSLNRPEATYYLLLWCPWVWVLSPQLRPLLLLLLLSFPGPGSSNQTGNMPHLRFYCGRDRGTPCLTQRKTLLINMFHPSGRLIWCSPDCGHRLSNCKTTQTAVFPSGGRQNVVNDSTSPSGVNYFHFWAPG